MCRISAHNKMSELLNRNTDPLFEKMEKIFKERDAEYKKMEERNRVREEAVKEKENSLKKQEEQFSSREENVRQQEQKIKDQAQEIQKFNEEIEKWKDKADEWEEKESGFVAQIDTLNKEKAQLWKKLMGVEDESLPEREEDVPDKTEEPVEERVSGAEEPVEEVEEVEVVPEEESVYAKEEENLKEAMEMDTPLTAEGFYNYLQEQEVGGVIQLRHAKQGDMVSIAISQIVVTVVFAEEGWFDIKKSIGNNNRKLRRLIRSWNSSQNDLTFKYDTSDNTVTAEGDFNKDQTAEELLRYLDRLLDTYFDTEEEE